MPWLSPLAFDIIRIPFSTSLSFTVEVIWKSRAHFLTKIENNLTLKIDQNIFLDTLDWFCLYVTDRLYLEDAIYAWTKNCLLLLSCKLSGMDDDQECWPGTAVSAAAAI